MTMNNKKERLINMAKCERDEARHEILKVLTDQSLPHKTRESLVYTNDYLKRMNFTRDPERSRKVIKSIVNRLPYFYND
jgi:hypothetical protein